MLNFIIKFILIVIILVSSSCARELKKVTIQLQWKHQFEFAGFYASKEMGYYKDVVFIANYFKQSC